MQIEDHPVTLIKVPARLAASWADQADQQELGRVCVEIDLVNDTKTYSLQQGQQRWGMQPQTDTMPLVVFSDAPSVEGRVTQRFSLTSSDGFKLHEKNKQRGIQTVVGHVRVPVEKTSMKTSAKEKVSDKTRSRLVGDPGKEKEPLQLLLFRLFERKPRWTFTELQAKTQQPTTWLKEVLRDIAQKAAKGTWEVKEKYRTS